MSPIARSAGDEVRVADPARARPSVPADVTPGMCKPSTCYRSVWTGTKCWWPPRLPAFRVGVN